MATEVEAAFAMPVNEGHTLVGIAFAAAQLWIEPTCRVRATELLYRLFAEPNDRINFAAMTVFKTRDEIPLDESTMRLLRQVDAFPDALFHSGLDEAFFEHLIEAFVVDIDLVCRISEEAVRRRSAKTQSLPDRSFRTSPILIDISLRLQRYGGDYRRRGMELFEALLDLEVAEAIGIVSVSARK